MFNEITESLIKQIPNIENVDIERLPQFLSRSYAKILGFKMKYVGGEKGGNREEFVQDLKQLEIIANTLEVCLVCNSKIENKKSVAYVSAVARKLIGMMQPIDDSNLLSLHYLPVNLSAILLFVISGNFADAKELADNIKVKEIDNPWKKSVFVLTQDLVGGRLDAVIRQQIEIPSIDYSQIELAEILMWNEFLHGIKHLCTHLLIGQSYQSEEFIKIKELSVEDLGLYGQKNIFVGSFLLASLYLEVASVLSAHAVIKIPTPTSLDSYMWSETLKKVAERRPYIWDNHIEAIQKGILDSGVSAVLTFPTGAGKTTLSELKVATTLQLGKRILYIVPTHALEFQVQNDLSNIINCFSFSTNRDAEFSLFDEREEEKQILVMTPEHCMTLLKAFPKTFENVGLVVFDEFHLISGDINDVRAVDAMYLLIQLLALHNEADFLLMSAVVHNGSEIADWVSTSTGRRCELLDCSWKPTSQLQGCLVYEKQRLSQLQSIIHKFRYSKRTVKTVTKWLRNQLIIIPKCLYSLKSVWNTTEESDYYFSDLMSTNVHLDVSKYWKVSANTNYVSAEITSKFVSIGMKTIIFASTPSYANAICKYLNKILGVDYTSFFKTMKNNFERLIAELGDWAHSYLSICHSATVHHGLLLPEERFLSEKYFKTGNVAVMVATSTLAQGINFPADIVIIAGTDRFNERQKKMVRIDAHEILNAAGRAGRAGYKSQGTVIVIPNSPISIENNKKSIEWHNLKNEIFSKGDRCLDVIDPFEILLKNDDFVLSPFLYNRLNEKYEHIAKSFRQSFYAYKMRKDGLNGRVEKRIKYLSDSICQKNSGTIFFQDLSIKTGMSISNVESLYNKLEDGIIINLNRYNALDLFNFFDSVMLSNMSMTKEMFMSLNLFQSINKELGLKEHYTNTIRKIFDCSKLYMEGENLYDIELFLSEKVENFLPKARRFVMKIIPIFSYFAGIFIQVVIAKMQSLGMTEISNDVKTFASCVKEGVISFDMLMAKYKNKWMRVECHQKFKI